MAKLGERDQERLAPFVTEMVQWREYRGWSQAELAKKAQYSKALIGSVEIFERAPTRVLATALDKAFDVPGTFGRLYELVRGSAFPAAFGEFATYEAQAATLMIFEHAYIPGLAQTEQYAEAVLSHHHSVTPELVAERVALRMARQAVLSRTDPPPPIVWMLIDEFALHRCIGGPVVMADQLARLAVLAQQPGISVQVIPAATGAHPGLSGLFYLAELRDGSTILFAEDISDGSITDEPATVAEVTQRWRYLSSLALPVAASLALIEERRIRWETLSAQALTAGPTGGLASE